MSDENEDGTASSEGRDRARGRIRRPLPEDGGDAFVQGASPLSDSAILGSTAGTPAKTWTKLLPVGVPAAAVVLAAIISATLPLTSPKDPGELGVGGWVYLAVALATAVFLFIPARR
jgi:hypothetical protein